MLDREITINAMNYLNFLFSKENNSGISLKSKLPYIYKYELAITAIVRNEGSCLEEWLNYYIVAGVEKFYIYDNESNDNTIEILQPYVDKGIVDLRMIPDKGNTNVQLIAFNDSLVRNRFECRYMAFVDADEFILGFDDRSLSEIIDDIMGINDNAGGVGINWRIFGSSGVAEKKYNSVLRNFIYRKRQPDICIKSIVNPRRTLFKECHHAEMFMGKCLVDEQGEYIHHENERRPDSKIVMNHYLIKSREDFVHKQARGDAYFKNTVPPRSWGYFYSNDRYDLVDYDILYYYRKRCHVIEYGIGCKKNNLLQRDRGYIDKYFSIIINEWQQSGELDITVEDFLSFWYNQRKKFIGNDSVLKSLDGIFVNFVKYNLNKKGISIWDLDLLISVNKELKKYKDFYEYSKMLEEIFISIIEKLKEKNEQKNLAEYFTKRMSTNYIRDAVDFYVQD